MKTGYIFRTLKLLTIIVNTSYFVGIVFYIISDINVRIKSIDSEQDYFIHFYDVHSMDDKSIVILLVYYTFTSLSTVGFGDLTPRSDCERLFCAFILLFGVAIFSYILGELTNILE